MWPLSQYRSIGPSDVICIEILSRGPLEYSRHWFNFSRQEFWQGRKIWLLLAFTQRLTWKTRLQNVNKTFWYCLGYTVHEKKKRKKKKTEKKRGFVCVWFLFQQNLLSVHLRHRISTIRILLFFFQGLCENTLTPAETPRLYCNVVMRSTPAETPRL